MRWLALALAAIGPAAAATPETAGQWIWCRADATRFETARATMPALRPGVFVSTIDVEQGRVVQRLALSPRTVESAAGVALVVRFDDGFRTFWSIADAAAARAAVAAKLAWLVRRAEAMRVNVAEVQLDYDCPTRRLAEWAALAGELARGSLRAYPTWVTSLPVHMEVRAYGDRFRAAVAGHILQVFDVGPRAGPAGAPRLAALARAQRMPFRLGVGAFERVHRDGATGAILRATEHGRWFEAADAFAGDTSFRGLWVFPGGMAWARAH